MEKYFNKEFLEEDDEEIEQERNTGEEEVEEEKNNCYEDEICGRCEKKLANHNYKGYMLCDNCIEIKKERKKKKVSERKPKSKEGKSLLFN